MRAKQRLREHAAHGATKRKSDFLGVATDAEDCAVDETRFTIVFMDAVRVGVGLILGGSWPMLLSASSKLKTLLKSGTRSYRERRALGLFTLFTSEV